jgi:two-component system, NarL family, response regulator, fimbrial Z protein, FimZ
MIRLFMIEDHQVTIAGLKSFFRPSRDNVLVSLMANSIEEAVNINDPDLFDIIILDLWLPDGEPTENYDRLAKRFPQKPIVIYSSELSLHWIRKMYKLGIKAFLNKTAEKSLIQKTLERVMKGEIVYPVSLAEYQSKRIVNGYSHPKFGLTKEQQEIIHLFIEGTATKQIAVILGKDHSTINKSIKEIRKIFDASNNINLTRILLSLEEFTPKSRSVPLRDE